jgi:hypothetical protein
MSVKQLINQCLKVIGQTGFGGITVETDSGVKALDTLLAEPLASTATNERLKVYRNLRRQELIQISLESPSTIRVTLTPAGAYRLSESALTDLTIATPGRWDSKWRMVTYDIPSSKSHERYVLVSQLKRLNFVMIQKSVWLHPHPCAAVVEQLTDTLGVTRYTTVAELTMLDKNTSARLKKEFLLF